MDALDSVNKWYYATIIDIDQNTEKIKLWWINKYDPRIQTHRMVEANLVVLLGLLNKYQTMKQINNQISIGKTQFKICIFIIFFTMVFFYILLVW